MQLFLKLSRFTHLKQSVHSICKYVVIASAGTFHIHGNRHIAELNQTNSNTPSEMQQSN
jgi:hypothetical protein